MEGPLVDAEGFPRADVNVYQIRTARHSISCKRACSTAMQYNMF